MKITKNTKLKKLPPNSQPSRENLSPNPRTFISFPPPKKVHCFQCQKEFGIKFVVPQKDYSQKNNWDY